MSRSRSSAGCVLHPSSALLAGALVALGSCWPAALHGALIQRVDATVAGSVITNASGVVTNWVDQSGSGNNASSLLGTVSFPSASLSASGKAGLAFGPTSREALQLLNASVTASFLNLQPGSSTNSGFAVLVAFKCDALTNSSTSDWNDLIGNGDEGSPANGFLMRYNSAGTLQAYLNGSFIQKSSTATYQVAPGNTIVLGFNYNTNGSYAFWDSKSGTSLTGTKAAASFATGNVLKLGTTQNANRYFKGMVGEVRIYNQVLSASSFKAEREQPPVERVLRNERPGICPRAQQMMRSTLGHGSLGARLVRRGGHLFCRVCDSFPWVTRVEAIDVAQELARACCASGDRDGARMSRIFCRPCLLPKFDLVDGILWQPLAEEDGGGGRRETRLRGGEQDRVAVRPARHGFPPQPRNGLGV